MIRLFYTLKPLRREQFWYRLWYPVKRKLAVPGKITAAAMAAAAAHKKTDLFRLPAFDQYDPAERTFTLLNIKHSFRDAIDWNMQQYGRLWTYHLNYFGWLADETLSIDQRLETLRLYEADERAERKKSAPARLEPYPISLRGMNIIRFVTGHHLQHQDVIACLYQHYSWLYYFPEYHLQGNHLWQNGCSLFCAGLYFKEDRFYEKGKDILQKALREQVMPDGGHIEGSPMYHSLLLAALMQCIELADQLGTIDTAFVGVMRSVASAMLGWAAAITFSDDSWPQVNDSTADVAPDLKTLRAFAAGLNICEKKMVLKESNYRMLRYGGFELFADIGSIQPAWQSGHAHSDELSFCLYVDGQPFIVDPGVHTYENNEARKWERSTDAHNTLSVAGKNASDVWKSFRVGRKARVAVVNDEDHSLCACHDGYGFGVTRKFFLGPTGITIEDILTGTVADEVFINLHFAPGISIVNHQDGFVAGSVLIKIKDNFAAFIEPYEYATGFNKTITAFRLHITGSLHTITTFEIINAD